MVQPRGPQSLTVHKSRKNISWNWESLSNATRMNLTASLKRIEMTTLAMEEHNLTSQRRSKSTIRVITWDMTILLKKKLNPLLKPRGNGRVHSSNVTFTANCWGREQQGRANHSWYLRKMSQTSRLLSITSLSLAIMMALLIIRHQYLMMGKLWEGSFVLRIMPQRLLLAILQINRMVMPRKIKHSNGWRSHC